MTTVNVEVAVVLPYRLSLATGPCPTPAIGGSVALAVVANSTPSHLDDEGVTRASSVISVDPAASLGAVIRGRTREAGRLLARVNQLLRWRRVTTGRPTVVELTRAQVARFTFDALTRATTWTDLGDLAFEPTRFAPAAAVMADQVTEAVLGGMAGRSEPDVAALNLHDAEYAVSVGRCREAVLLCWSVIDSTFVRTFERLVDQQLPGEWPDGRKFLRGSTSAFDRR